MRWIHHQIYILELITTGMSERDFNAGELFHTIDRILINLRVLNALSANLSRSEAVQIYHDNYQQIMRFTQRLFEPLKDYLDKLLSDDDFEAYRQLLEYWVTTGVSVCKVHILLCL